VTSSRAMHFLICVPMPNVKNLNPTTFYTHKVVNCQWTWM
jgi:hypothetical protein